MTTGGKDEPNIVLMRKSDSVQILTLTWILTMRENLDPNDTSQIISI
jgi:hypothetical protein